MPKSCGQSLWPCFKGDKLPFLSGLEGLAKTLRLIVCIHTEEPNLTLRCVENATVSSGDYSWPFFPHFALECLIFVSSY